jgi:hypothetical protein
MPQYIQVGEEYIEFPDDMPDNQINEVLSKYSQQPKEITPPTPNQLSNYDDHLAAGTAIIPQKKGYMEQAWEGIKAVGSDFAALPGAIYEGFTGEQRMTPEIQGMRDVANIPEMNQWSLPATAVAAGTLMTPPEQTMKVFKTWFPDNPIRTDEKGNFIIKSLVDGKEYALKPGFSASDVGRVLSLAGLGKLATKVGGLFAEMMGGGTAATLAGTAGGEVLVQTGVEGTSAALGGDFNKGNILASAVIPPLLQGGGMMARKGVQSVADMVEPSIGRMGSEAMQSVNEAVMPNRPAPLKYSTGEVMMGPKREIVENVSQVKPQAQLTPEQIKSSQVMNPRKEVVDSESIYKRSPEQAQEFKSLVSRASNGNEAAKKELADSLGMDPIRVQAAIDEGVIDDLQMDHLSTNFAFKEFQQLLKSEKSSALRDEEQAGLTRLGNRAVKMIKDFGANEDIGGLSDSIKANMDKTVSKFSYKEKAIYDSISKQIPDGTPAQLKNTKAHFDARISKLGSAEKLPSVEKKLYDKLFKDAEDINTYHFLDDQRQLVGADVGAFDKLNSKEKMLMGNLYDSMTKDQELTLSGIDPDLINQWNSAKGVVKMKYAVINDMKKLFGNKMEDNIVNKLLAANTALSKTDADKFTKMITAIPQKYREEFTASAILSAFGKATENGKLNYTTFPNWFDNISKSVKGKTAIASNLPDGAFKRLQNLSIIARGVSDSTKKYSGTGASLQKYFNTPDTLIKNIYNEVSAVKGASSLGVGGIVAMADPQLGIAVGTTMGLSMAITNAVVKSKTPLMQKANNLITSDVFRNYAIASTKNNAKMSEMLAKKLADSKEFRQFADLAKIGDKAKIAWIMKATEQQEEKE